MKVIRINARSITEIIKNSRVDFIKERELDDYQMINSGWCDRFAEEVLSQLQGNDFYEMESYELLQINEEEDYGLLERELVLEYFGMEIPLELVNKSIGYHVWLTNGTTHFDAECPEGVNCFYDLPFFQRYMHHT